MRKPRVLRLDRWRRVLPKHRFSMYIPPDKVDAMIAARDASISEAMAEFYIPRRS